MFLVRCIVWLVARLGLPLRYRLRVHGLEQVRGLKGPTLLLPNHPAYVDPILLLTVFWPSLRPRPLVAEVTFKNPLFYPFMKVINAVSVPDMTKVDARAHTHAGGAVQEVIAGLKRGENQIFWPAGRLQRRGTEVLGGARALSEVLKAVPEANIVAVRTRGLWGSRFGFARTGKLPNFGANILASLGWLLAGLVFFMPRREVNITVRRIDRAELPELDRSRVNAWFEAWYNADGPEEPKYVPYHLLFGPRSYDYPELARLNEVDLDRVQPETKQAVAQLLAEKLNRPLAERESAAEVMLDQLGLDSLGRMELALDVERAFGHTCDEVPENVGQVWALAQGLTEKAPPGPAPAVWFRPPEDDGPAEILGNTIPESFAERALRGRRDVALADDLSGVLTYERVLAGALIFARRFTDLPGKNVGLLLPASVGADLAFLGMQLAGKVPVVLNWTTGPANLGHAVKLMGLTHVVTSRAFVNRLHVELPGTKCLYLEDLRKEVGTLERLRTLFLVRRLPGRVRAKVPTVNPDDPAVVLFTSGSEKAPKAVPLTHRNLLSNMRAGMEAFQVTRADSMLGFLPMFHSFGLAVTGLLPLLAGVRVVRHPDPRESGKLVRKIAAYHPTLLLATPTFLSHMLQRATGEELKSLRLIMVGAEKCPTALFEQVARLAPQATLLEGYGITECSPVVTANRPGNHRPGTIGQALSCVQLRVVDHDTGEPLPPGRQGMLLVGGPSVFPGYIGNADSPFREIDGTRWYVTGDLVEMDEAGVVTFKGRLKRFLKSGGEMVSLPALEEPLALLYPPTEEGPRVAVEGCEANGRAHVVLFTTEAITLVEANNHLKQAGLHGVMRLDEVRRVDHIPTLGSGKVDYKQLRALVERERQAAQAEVTVG